MENAAPDRIDFSAIETLALGLLSTVGWISVCALPYEISMFSAARGMDLISASSIATGELLALAIGVAFTDRFTVRGHVRATMAAALLVAILSSGLSAIATSFLPALAARLLFGLATGVAGATASSLAGRHAQPERMFAIVLIILCPVFSIIMYAVPALEPRYGLNALFLVEGGLIVALGLATIFLRVVPESLTGSVPRRSPLPRSAILVLGGLALLYVSQALVWGYAEQAGLSLGIHGTFLGTLFLASAVGQLPGSLAAAAIGARLRFRIPILSAFVLLVLIYLGFYCSRSTLVFSSSVLGFNGVTAFLVPYVQGLLPELDPNGRSSAMSIGAINFGSAAGPAIGLTTAFMPSLSWVGIISVVILLASMLCVHFGILGLKSSDDSMPALATMGSSAT